MAEYRNVWTLILAVGLMQVGGGILGVITPLGLGEMGLNGALIGAVAALYAAGFMAGAWTAPRAVTAFGYIRVFAASAGLLTASTLAMGLADHPLAWAGVRLVQGFTIAWMFASSESWMSSTTPAHARGGVLGFYHVIAKAALLAGPFIIFGLTPRDPDVFLWIAVFLALSLVPVCLTRKAEPFRAGTRAMGPLAIARLAPAALMASFLAGVINSGALALLPVYADAVDLGGLTASTTEAAAFVVAAAWIGGLVSQWPLGRLSDRFDRRTVVAAMGAVCGLAALALGLFTSQLESWAILTLLAIWGAGSLSFYGIGIAHAVDRAPSEDISAVMSGLLFIWALGSVIGPPIAGASVETGLGEGGLFVFVAAMTACLVLAMVVRRSQRPEAREETRENWEMTRPTSLATIELDPRGDETAI